MIGISFCKQFVSCHIEKVFEWVSSGKDTNFSPHNIICVPKNIRRRMVNPFLDKTGTDVSELWSFGVMEFRGYGVSRFLGFVCGFCVNVRKSFVSKCLGGGDGTEICCLRQRDATETGASEVFGIPQNPKLHQLHQQPKCCCVGRISVLSGSFRAMWIYPPKHEVLKISVCIRVIRKQMSFEVSEF